MNLSAQFCFYVWFLVIYIGNVSRYVVHGHVNYISDCHVCDLRTLNHG